MINNFDRLRRLLQSLKLDDSMVFLAHLLAVVRREIRDPSLEHWINKLQQRPPAFVIHFVLKWLLLEASNLGYRRLDWQQYKELQDLYFEIDDPTIQDNGWSEGDTTGFFERLFADQLPAQERFTSRDIGLTLAIFCEVGSHTNDENYNLKSELESELGVSVEHFIAIGYVVWVAYRAALSNGHVRVTLTSRDFEEIHSEGIRWCTPQVWESFFRRTILTRDQFRKICSRPEYRVKSADFSAFEFNPIRRYPIINLGHGCLVAVDPDMIIKRVTDGLYFDLFEKHGVAFSRQFGKVFERVIGCLLRSVVNEQFLWSDTEWKSKEAACVGREKLKKGDWAVTGSKYTVLFECKSVRPSLALRQYGSQEAIDDIRRRMVEGLVQLMTHARDVEKGLWTQEGLDPRPCVCVLISYGRFYTSNLPSFRRRIERDLLAEGVALLPYVILSVEEFDRAIRLSELGQALDEILYSVSQCPDSYDVLKQFDSCLEGQVVSSSFAHSRYQEYINMLTTIFNQFMSNIIWGPMQNENIHL